MFKVTKGLAPVNFSNVFNTRNKLNYNLRHVSHFDVPIVNIVYNGTESIYGVQSLGYVPQKDKRDESNQRPNKKWKPENCT